jgi:hypothetical protein
VIKMAKTTYTQRTLAELRKRGYTCEVVERWMTFTGRTDGSMDDDGRAKGGGYRRDLFKFIDIIAMTPEGILAVQSTSHAQIAAHRRKIMHTPDIRDNVIRWQASGGLFKLWGWQKVGNRWRVTESDLEQSDAQAAKLAALKAGWAAQEKAEAGQLGLNL